MKRVLKLTLCAVILFIVMTMSKTANAAEGKLADVKYAENTDGNDMQDENVEQSEINGVGGRRKCGDSGSGNRTICRKNTDGIRCGVHKRKL